MSRQPKPLLIATVCLALTLLPSALHAQTLPVTSLTAVSPAGAKVGTDVDVTISGTDLDDVDRLIFSHAGITSALKMEQPGEFLKTARPMPGEFSVKVAGNVPAGLYEVRAAGRYGMSNPRVFQVANWNEISEAGDNKSIDKAMEVPTSSVVNGQVDSDAIDYFRIHAVKGQRLIVDCWAQRMDSRMDATLLLLDAKGKEIRRVQNTDGLDPVLDINADSDGDYIVGVYDFTYGGGGDFFYRLAVHTGPYIDFVFPPVGQPGASGKFTLYGRNLPGAKPTTLTTASGSPLESVEVNIALPGDAAAMQKLGLSAAMKPHEGVVSSMSYQLTSPSGPSNNVDIGFAFAPVIVENDANDDSAKPQAVTVPCEVVGQFYPRGDQDWVQFDAQAGDVLWIDVLSHRLGLPTDPTIIIQQVTKNEQGEVSAKQIASNDDFAPQKNNSQPQLFSLDNRDPAYRFEAKADGAYRVGIADLYSGTRGDPRMMYRLIIRKPQPDFQLLVFNSGTGAVNQFQTGGTALRRGETRGMTVQVVRRDGFDGDIEISAEGLPSGVTSAGAIVGGKSETTQLLLTATADAPAWAGGINVVGKAKIGDSDVTHEARTGALIWGSKNIAQEIPVARMTRDIGLSVIDKETAPATATAGDGNVIETSIGAKIEVPIKVARHGEFKGPIKFKALELPTQVTAPEANITGADGKIEISLANNRVEPGSYTLYLSGPAKFKYNGNPDVVVQAEARQKELDEILKAFTEQAKQAADKAKTDRDAANKNKEDQSLADAATKAEEQSKAVEAKRKQAEDLKKKSDADLKAAQDANKPKDINFDVLSTPIKIRVVATPLSVAATSPGAKKQGEMFQLPVTIERKYGFDDQVELTFEPPSGVGGVGAAKVTVPKGQNQGMLEIKLNDNATEGEHQFTLRGRVKFNNVQLDETQAIALKIEKKPE